MNSAKRTHACGPGWDPPIHEWIPRVENPVQCPQCKVLLRRKKSQATEKKKEG